MEKVILLLYPHQSLIFRAHVRACSDWCDGIVEGSRSIWVDENSFGYGGLSLLLAEVFELFSTVSECF